MSEQAQTESKGIEGEPPAGQWGGGDMRLMKVLMWSGAVVAVVAVIAFAFSRGVHEGVRRAPALPKQTLTGPRVTLASLHGEPALVLFWASWCGACRREASAVQRFSESSAGKGRIVGVDWGDHVSAAKAFIRRHHWSFSNLRDRSGQIGLSYGLAKLPALFLVDSEGHVVKAVSGAQSEQSLARLLASQRH